MSIAIIYGGTRPDGNAETLAEFAVKDLPADKIYLRDYNIQPINDQRHDPEGFQAIDDDCESVISRMMEHDILIFSTPIYWYSMTGTMKNFIDRWSQSMRDLKRPDFLKKLSEKKAYVIAVGGDAPRIKGLPLIQQFHYIFDFTGVSFEGYILGEGNKPGDIKEDLTALGAAHQLYETLKKWNA
ncbi:flavodoxin family protein [Metabacillus sp. GX 13764]|uniref:flavodoxin family protein n=1 Tax=Metabacillus kandeliae TaxID=2900151 RepID=UPI001E486783|nr:flavodoxin family protein [Metabacillus kandeliae]MCD7035947.1 flavodoxin family protein [Metabacillus kandeliae]